MSFGLEDVTQLICRIGFFKRCGLGYLILVVRQCILDGGLDGGV